jgi:hypothetical protein
MTHTPLILVINGETPGYKRKEFKCSEVKNLFECYTAEWQAKGNLIVKVTVTQNVSKMGLILDSVS